MTIKTWIHNPKWFQNSSDHGTKEQLFIWELLTALFPAFEQRDSYFHFALGTTVYIATPVIHTQKTWDFFCWRNWNKEDPYLETLCTLENWVKKTRNNLVINWFRGWQELNDRCLNDRNQTSNSFSGAQESKGFSCSSSSQGIKERLWVTELHRCDEEFQGFL